MKIDISAALRLALFSLACTVGLAIVIYERLTYGAANAFATLLVVMAVLVAPTIFSSYKDELKQRKRG